MSLKYTVEQAMSGQAILINGSGGPEVLSVSNFEIPEPGPGQVQVLVRAAGVNRADVLQRKGVYPAPKGTRQDIPGLEYAGVVEKVGQGVDANLIGKRVMGLVPGAAMATHLVTDHRELIPIPKEMSFTDAAALPEACLTAYDGLLQGNAKKGDQVLIHAIGSGVGTIGLQIARTMGCSVLGTSRTQEKLTRARDLGNYTKIHVEGGLFSEKVLASTGGKGADVVIDLVGAAYLEENLNSIAYRGRLVAIGLVGGSQANLPMLPLLQKRVMMVGTVMRSRQPEERFSLAKKFIGTVLPWLEDGHVRPVVSEVTAMKDVAEAHRALEANSVFGKIVLAWS